MFDLATDSRQTFCRNAGRYNGRVRRACFEFCAAVGAGVIIGQIIDLVLNLVL
jgi:hypothetical protein